MSARSRMALLIAACTLALCQLAFAQVYTPPGGGMPTGTVPTGVNMPGSPGYVPPAHGYKANPALIGGLVGGGAAAGGGIWYFMRHHNVYQGCVGPDGKTLIRDKDGMRFQLQDSTLTPGQRVSLKAKKMGDSGSTLDVQDVRKSLGPCERTAGARP